MEYPNLILLCGAFPDMGYGSMIKFKNEPETLSIIGSILSHHGGAGLIMKRSDYLCTCENDNITPIEFGEWLDDAKQTNTFEGYMLRHYKFAHGVFEFSHDIDTLEKLAGKIGYYSVNT